jgi:hypothetical protein
MGIDAHRRAHRVILTSKAAPEGAISRANPQRLCTIQLIAAGAGFSNLLRSGATMQKRSAALMLAQQGGAASCLVSNTAEGDRFRFPGGAPGWSACRQPAMLETVILMSPNGTISTVEYNGPIRVRPN